MAPAVHQIVPNLRSGDAVGNTVLKTRKILRSFGLESDIYCEQHSSDLAGDVMAIEDYLDVSDAESVVLYHYSIGSETGRFVYHLPDRVVLIYHNITPPEYFLDVHNHVVGELYHGRKQVRQFADRVAWAVGDSEFNARELRDMGFRNTSVLPLALDFSDFDGPADPTILSAYDDFKRNFLFVGRIVPNKALDDLIRLFAHFKKYVHHDCRLIMVGDWSGFEAYHNSLLHLIDTIQMPDVLMTGRVDFSQLLAFYSVADAYISLSRHEGFCVPLLEAMYMNLPVMARGSAAVPETMDGAGVVVDEAASYAEMAEMMDMITSEGYFKEELLKGQHQRLQRFMDIDFKAELLELLRQLGVEL